MITVSIFRDDTDMITGFRFDGHAGFARRGRDVVCAAVSMLVINTINSIEKFTSDGLQGEHIEKKGIIEFHVTGEISPETQVLLNSLHLGLCSVVENYGTKYLKLVDELQTKSHEDDSK